MEETKQYLDEMNRLAGVSQLYNNPVAGFLGGHEAYDSLQNINAMQYQTAVNANEAEKLRGWQERLSNTEISRRVKDLESVGFSPMALMQGVSGASTPSGASGSAGSGHSGSSHNGGGFLDILKTVGLMVLGGVKLGAAKSLASEKLAQNAVLAEAKNKTAEYIAETNGINKIRSSRIMKGLSKYGD